MELTPNQINEIPWQSLGILLMYRMGVDPRKKMARSTYYVHKRILLEHGFDVNPKTLKK